MARLTAAERLAKTKARVAHTNEKLRAELRADEAAAREEARSLHLKHLWAIARLCDTVGLSAHSLEVLTPELEKLAVRLTTTVEGQREDVVMATPAGGSVSPMRC